MGTPRLIKAVSQFLTGATTLVLTGVLWAEAPRPGERAIAELVASEDSSQPSFAPASDWDDDLGVRVLLREAPAYRPWTLRINQGAFWTDNAGYEDDRVVNDTADEDVYSSTFLGATYLPRLYSNLYGDVHAHQYFYRYLDRSDLDFDDSRLGIGGVFVVRRLGDLSINGRYQFNRLTRATFGEELLEEHVLQLGAYKPFILERDHFLYLRALAEISLDADPGHVGRHEFGGLAGYRWRPADRIELDCYYRYRFLDYTDQDRSDHQQLVGVQLQYEIREELKVGISGNYVINDSNAFGLDYEAGTLGAFVTLGYRF